MSQVAGSRNKEPLVLPYFIDELIDREVLSAHEVVHLRRARSELHPIVFLTLKPTDDKKPPQILLGDVQDHPRLFLLHEHLPAGREGLLKIVRTQGEIAIRDSVSARLNGSLLAAGTVGKEGTVRAWNVHGFGPKIEPPEMLQNDIRTAIYDHLADRRRTPLPQNRPISDQNRRVAALAT